MSTSSLQSRYNWSLLKVSRNQPTSLCLLRLYLPFHLLLRLPLIQSTVITFLTWTTLPCTALQNLKLINPVFNISHCLPYFANPCKEDNSEKITYVEILYPLNQFTIIDEFDWERDDLQKFTNDLIAAEELPEDHKDPFMEYVRGKIEDGKRSTYEARVKRETVKGKLSQEEVDAFENMRFYKFYPVATPDTPCVDERIKSLFINSHYGKAHQLL